MQDWAAREASVAGLVLIGSQARERVSPVAADAHSDWDFQVITSRPALFFDAAWTSDVGLGQPVAYVARGGRLGSANKVSAVFAGGVLDVVLIPAGRLRLARTLVRFGLDRRLAGVRKGLGDLALVLRGGFKILKGAEEWGAFFTAVATTVPLPRLADAAVRALAEGFYCDYVSTRQKLRRGEWLAAQRWLHLHLVEVNFQLMNEVQQRRGLRPLHDGRRSEFVLSADELATMTVSATVNGEALAEAVERSAAACRTLVGELLGEGWRWPGPSLH